MNQVYGLNFVTFTLVSDKRSENNEPHMHINKSINYMQ